MEPDTGYSETSNTVTVRVRMPGLEGSGCCGCDSNSEPHARNATFDGPYYEEKSYRVTATVNGESYTKMENLQYPIVPGDSYAQAKKDFLHIILKKKNTGQSFEDVIRMGHL